MAASAGERAGPRSMAEPTVYADAYAQKKARFMAERSMVNMCDCGWWEWWVSGESELRVRSSRTEFAVASIPPRRGSKRRARGAELTRTIAAGASVSGVALQARSMGTAGKSGKKMKSYSSFKKRFKLSKKTGEYTRRRSGSAHLMQKKSKSQKRRLRLSTTTHEGYASVMKRLGFKKTKFC